MPWGYALGGSRTAGARLRVGAEIFGNFTEREHFAGPVLALDVTPRCACSSAAVWG